MAIDNAIGDAQELLRRAQDADQPAKLGYLELASDSIKAARTAAKKGVKNAQGEMVGQSTLDEIDA